MLGKSVLRIPGETAYLERVRSFVIDYARKIGFNDDGTGEIELAVDELCTNIIRYSYNQDPDIPPELKQIEVEVEEIKKGIQITVKDHGKPFDPGRFPLVNLDDHISELRTHGLGIYTMKKFMDKLKHEYKEGRGNNITLIKKLKK